ncbi:molybdate ABC transporter substrate-binding protein [Sulfurimonas sp.]
MKKLFFFFILLSSLLNAANITIAVAANVSYAIDALKGAFEKQHPDITVRIILGGSGKLTAQIKNGAPYDILMSANMDYPNALYKEKLAMTKPLVYAQGSLALFSNRVKDFSKGLDIVKEVRTIAVANPKTAPYGKATIEALKNAKLYEKVKNKFVFGESISQTVAYSVTAADLGFIAKSALYSPKMKRFKEGRNYIEIPNKLYTPIKQGIVILKRAKNNKDVLSFYRFILSKKAKVIFKEYGYSVNE